MSPTGVEALRGMTAEEMYDYLEQEKLFPEEQKRCR